MATQKELLFLAHRIPYPPNKGDKIRSFHLLKHLARSHRVHMGAFVDDPQDWRYRTDLEALCAETCLLDLPPRQRRVASLKGLLNGQPLTLPYYARPAMQRWVDEVITRHPIEAVVVFSSPMAQYVEQHDHLRRLVDFVDIDSDKWAQYARSTSWPLRWIYAREARTLLAYERRIAADFDASIFVSDDESDLFKKLAPEVAGRVSAVHNGVDTDYFSPERDYPNPYQQAGPVITFTGAMDYWANVDAVRWFAEAVFPGIREQAAEASFCIVGSHPGPEVLALAKRPGITVTGAVPDIRPYLAHATLVVAPMRIARGVQNKVLEAMAMARPVLVTPAAAEGICASPGVELVVAGDASAQRHHALRLLAGEEADMGSMARRCVLRHYGWAQNLRCIDELLAMPGNSPAAGVAL